MNAHTKDGCPLPRKIRNIRFFLDTSASMAGYFSGGTEFRSVVMSMVAKIDKNLHPADIYFTDDDTLHPPINAGQLNRLLADRTPKDKRSSGKRPAGGKEDNTGSPLDQLIAKVGGHTGADDLSLLVTDGISSYSNKEIRANSEVNKNALDKLKNDIFSTFSDLKRKKRFSAILYAYKSAFYGRYYNYRNGFVQLNGERRPFYMLAIGPPELMVQLEQELGIHPELRPEAQLRFGAGDAPVTDYDILSQIGYQGAWMPAGDGKGIEDIGDPKKAPVRCCIGVDLSRLPAYARTSGYLNAHLRTSCRSCTAIVTVKDKTQADESRLRGGQRSQFARSTHVLQIQLQDLFAKKDELIITLPLQYDNWYEQWSCADDIDPVKGCPGKTFGLAALVSGIREAYEDPKQQFIRLHLNLEQ